MAKKITAIGLFSGGLDSILAAKILQKQGIKVICLNIEIPFIPEDKKNNLKTTAKKLKIPLKTMKVGADYLKMVQNPKYHYGSAINPCIDCRIFILKKAKQLAKKTGAKFIFTGEVLGQRPMSQHSQAMELVEKQTGLKGKLLRPLCAKLLPKTEAEKMGWVKRDNLLDISGRSRQRQLSLAKKWRIKNFPTPAGGCLLTDKSFAKRLQDLFNQNKKISEADISLLKIGRHWRIDKNKIIIGRNFEENKKIKALKNPKDYYFETAKYPGPTGLLIGPANQKAIIQAAALTAAFSDILDEKAIVKYGQKKLNKKIIINQPKNYLEQLTASRII